MQRFFRVLVYPFWLLDASKKYRWIRAFLNNNDAILELGSGMGSVVQVLRQHGHQVTPVDIKDTSVRADLAPEIYDGTQLPYLDRQFDVCLLLTVLHHCPDPDRVLTEAGRVARQVVVIEDVYSSPWQRRLTLWLDSLLNWEFAGHPHNNRRHSEWQSTFKKLDQKIIFASKRRVAGVFCQVTYLLEPHRTGDKQ